MDSIIYIVAVLMITEDDVEAVLTLPDALAAVEGVFAAARETTDSLRRRRLYQGPTRLNVLGGAAGNRLAVKAYTRSDQSAVVLFSGEGDLLAVIEGKILSRLRTAAATGVATRWLSRADSSRVTILGTGWQAVGQLEAVCAVRPITSVAVWSPTQANREAFADRMSQALGMPVAAARNAAEAVDGSDIVVTATKAATPVLSGEWLAPGTHVNLVGANLAQHREADEAVVRRAAVVVVDDLEQAKDEAGELAAGVAEGDVDWDDVGELRDIIGGHRTGRTDDAQITLFKSLGIGLEDVAVAGLIYDRIAASQQEAV
jgi:ornithine cyclodeaminase/alanine dehydrogenase-like protein (mu-crystallin family)